MQDSDFLFTVAEVGVALAGFAGLVSVVGQRLGQARTGVVEAHQLRMMLIYCLLATGFALIPYIFQRAALGPDLTWRLSSLALGVVWGVFFGRAFPRANRLLRGASVRVRLLSYLGIAISATGLTLLGLNALGAFGRHAAVAYLAALLVLLLAAVRLFVRTFVSILNPGTPSGE